MSPPPSDLLSAALGLTSLGAPPRPPNQSPPPHPAASAFDFDFERPLAPRFHEESSFSSLGRSALEALHLRQARRALASVPNCEPALASASLVPSAKTFPEALHDFISSEEHADIISWLPHGRGFIIRDREAFVSLVLPRCFDNAKYTSFTRRLKRWGFVRVQRGPEHGAYYNRYFVRDHPHLVKKMKYRTDGNFDGADVAKKARAAKEQSLEERIEREVERRVRETLEKSGQGGTGALEDKPACPVSPQASPVPGSASPLNSKLALSPSLITPPVHPPQQLSSIQREMLVHQCTLPLHHSAAASQLDRSAAYHLLLEAKRRNAGAPFASASALPGPGAFGRPVMMSPAEEEEFAAFLAMKRTNRRDVSSGRLPMRKRIRCM